MNQTNQPSGPDGPELLDGIVVASAHGGDYAVSANGEISACRMRGRIKTAVGDRLAHLCVGDRVRFFRSPDEPERGRIDLVQPRTSELSRGRPGKPPQLIVANIDQVVVVASTWEPDLSLHRIDRFLTLSAMADVPAIVVLNKIDLDEDGELREEVESVYGPLGITVLCTSAETGEGLGALDDALTGKISAVVGVSGAGKSSLINGLNPGYALRTGEVMDIGKGRHTTTSTRLLPLDRGGWIADTPGIKTVALLASRVTPELLPELFPELEPFVGQCQFNNCSHRSEPGCLVRAGVEAGDIAESRYDSYVRLYEELKTGGT